MKRRDQAAGLEVSRTDRWAWRVDASSVVRHACGWVDAWGTAAVIGPMAYPEHGTVELADAETLFDAASLASLRGVPLTIGHPQGGEDVTSSNVRDLAHGWVLDYRRNGDELQTLIRFASDDVLATIEGGTVELSPGYDALYVEQAGTHVDGTPYTGVQRRRRYNHVSLVDFARGGSRARVRLDSARRDGRRWGMHALKIRGRDGKLVERKIPKWLADALQGQAADHAKGGHRDEIAVAEITIDGTQLILPKATVDQIIAMLGGEGQAAPEAPAPEAPLDAATGSTASPALRTDGKPLDDKAVEAIVAKRVDAVMRAERQRAEVERRAAPILGEGFDYSDPWQTCVAAIERVDEARGPDAKRRLDAIRDPKADAIARAEAQGYLLARLDDAATAHRDAADSSGDLAGLIDRGRRDAGEQRTDDKAGKRPIQDARKRMRDRMINGGKATTTTTSAGAAK